MRRVYRVLAADALYPDPYNLVVFADNHDVNRMFTALGERADLQRMAIALILTTRGIPQVFYGTEILMASPGPKNDGVIRSDFPGGWAGDRRNAFNGAGLTEAERSMQDYMRRLLQWRRTAPAIHAGKLTHFVPFEGVYVYFRHKDAQKVMVILNNNEEARTVEMQRFREVLGEARRGVDVVTKQEHDVTRAVEVPARSATVLELD
jgi:glycosidase